MERIQGLNDFRKTAWNLLYRAAYKRKGDLQKGVIATQHDLSIAQRIVVLREAIPTNRQLIFFTDKRSSKVQEMRTTPEVSWLFWDEHRKLQIRMNGTAKFNSNDHFARKYWDKLPLGARKSYATLSAPSSPIEEDSDKLPENWDNLTLDDSDKFYEHFLVIVTTIDEMQCLHLHAEGHQHAHFSWENDNWQGQWLVP